jgi:hypothetical protein
MTILADLIERARQTPIESVIEERGIKLSGKIERVGPCPHCKGEDRFSINVRKQVFNCRGCDAKGDVIALTQFLDGCDFGAAVETLSGSPINGKRTVLESSIKVDWGKERARYTYQQADGTPYLLVRKFVDADGKKQFPQSHWEGGSWVKGKPNGHKIPYRLPQLAAAPPSATVFIVEGEKDCDALACLSFVATCNSEGAGKWRDELNEHFRNRNVIILPDNDEPGRKHAEDVARRLHKIAASVRVVELPDLPPHGGDVSDWLRTDPSGARLVKECDRAPLWEPKDKDKIAELAALDKLDYGRARKDTAKALGVTATELDKIVAESRGKPDKEPERWVVEPWEEPVATSDLLTSLAEIYTRYVVLPLHGANVMALWVLHAWAIDAAYATAFLMFVSPEPRCGKSTALALVYRTAPRTTMASNISAAAIYRYIEAQRPTLLLDEAETFVTDNEDIRGILNSGHSRDTAHVIRLIAAGDDYQPKEFSTWGPKALASIGRLAATLRDRALIIPMKRRKAGEPVKKLRLEDTGEFATLRRKAQRWANDNIEALKKKRPKLPQGLNDRAQDNWEPLLAIAEVAGGDWPALAHKAALSLSEDLDEGSIRTKLLADIRKVFEAEREGRLTSLVLAAKLGELAGADEDAGPWGAFGKSGKPITQRQIAKLLSDFSIFPRTIRIEERPQAKGYLREQFEDAFERYLSPISDHPPVPAVPPSQSSDVKDLRSKRSVPPDFLGTDENDPNVLKDKDCDVGTAKTPPRTETGVSLRLTSQERVEAAEGAGCEFHLNERGVSWIYAPGANPNDPDLKLAEEAIEADRPGVEAFLRWRQAQRERKS